MGPSGVTIFPLILVQGNFDLLVACISSSQSIGSPLFPAVARHPSTTCNRCEFSSAAWTRSLSFNCLFTACSDWCAPGLIRRSTLKRGGSARISRTRRERPEVSATRTIETNL